MIIERNIDKFCVFAEDSILTALRKISDNKSRIVFSVTEHRRLEGIVTDGDIRRWLLDSHDFDLNQPVKAISNSNYTWASIDKSAEEISAMFSSRIEFVPLLDAQHHFLGFARFALAEVAIDEHLIGKNHPTFVIAEIGNNHNGSIEQAKKLVDEALKSGADCAKFQMRDMENLYANSGKANDASEDLGSQYTLDLLSRFNLDIQSLYEVFDYCKQRGITPLCTPWDMPSLSALEQYGMPAYKIASADLTNFEMLEALAKTGKPLILSTGMSSEDEILHAVELLRRYGANFVLLHCNSTYPAPFKDVNLSYISRLNEIHDGLIGYSGHERGYNIAVSAVSLGACVIEKHFTLDREMEGNDHKVSLLPDEFGSMVQAIREVEEAMGTSASRILSQGELMNREVLAKSLVASEAIAEGSVINHDNIAIKSPGRGLQPHRREDLVGKIARRDIKSGDFFYPSDLGEGIVEPRAYQFNRPWGIPVRYHDFSSLYAISRPDLLEFHLSYKDLELDPADFFTEEMTCELVVHAPELFTGDHILDLVSDDDDYVDESVRNLQKTIDATRALKKWFPKTQRPVLIVNVGGFSHNSFLPKEQRQNLYQKLIETLARLDQTGVEIIPQTMPPYPWHFGGQQYHNLFVDPDEIDQFCHETGYRVCFDVSHSALACNYTGIDLDECIHLVGPHTAHLHIVDAKGVDGEGLQIGDGDIDFASMAKALSQYSPNSGFIPEIWQGHKDGGSGFWWALERLEKWF